jgi:hypothetical protein
MNKTCDKCGSSNTEQARFCGKCGNPLQTNGSDTLTKEQTPAEQAAKVIKNAKVGTEILKTRTKKIWGNFTIGEKILAIGAIVVLVSFFMPWLSATGQTINGLAAAKKEWFVYFIPVSAIVSLALLYFSQGAQRKNKVLIARWQIVIGTFWGSITVFAIVAINNILSAIQQIMGGIGSMFGTTPSFAANIGIGLYLFAVGALAIIVGAFRLQKELS